MNVLNILENNKYPVDALTLVKKLSVNKTTVYRQLEKYVAEGKIIEVELGDGKKRFELKNLDHHHHLICDVCGCIEDIELNEGGLMDEINKKSKFKVEKHSLEFFGVCNKCN